MTVFWDPADQRWCDECDEYLQQLILGTFAG